MPNTPFSVWAAEAQRERDFTISNITPIVQSNALLHLNLDGTLKLINGLEDVLFEYQAEFNVEANVTGLHAIQRDELVTTERDMAKPFKVLVVGFRRVDC